MLSNSVDSTSTCISAPVQLKPVSYHLSYHLQDDSWRRVICIQKNLSVKEQRPLFLKRSFFREKETTFLSNPLWYLVNLHLKMIVFNGVCFYITGFESFESLHCPTDVNYDPSMPGGLTCGRQGSRGSQLVRAGKAKEGCCYYVLHGGWARLALALTKGMVADKWRALLSTIE